MVGKAASSHTRTANALGDRVFDPADLERVRRGFIASLDSPIVDGDGRVAHDTSRYEFLRDGRDTPDTVNPHLWRHATLNAHHGLFEVCDGVWQVRGYDISNITFIRGASGWIVVDPLTTTATARAAIELITEHLGHRSVVSVIYTHSHADHFGGVFGVTSDEEVRDGKCSVIAPEGFLAETIGENIIAGPAMARRATYQFGPFLEADPTGHVDCGLGNSIPIGAPGLIAPTIEIHRTGEELVVDGVRIVFQLTPETEAPAEMNFFFPDFGALCMAENCSHTMHNLVPIRGALVRNSLRWSKYINEAIELFGNQATMMFASHNWPRWGAQDVRDYLTLQRDLYRFIHDQTMRHANKGLVATEIAQLLELPPEFLAHEHTRGFYGDLVHNVKAVYQRYLSWYDANPANLHKYPPTEVGKRYVALAGGMEVLLEHAQKAFDAGDYRWVAELVNHAVFADPTNERARTLQADTLEQLGYQSESSTFRNAYLMGAKELRNGPPKLTQGARRARSMIRAMTVEQVFDAIAVRVKAELVGGVNAVVNWTFTDMAGTPDERWVLGLSNRTLFATQGRHDPHAAVTVTITRELLLAIVAQDTTFMDEIGKGSITLDGDGAALLSIFGNLEEVVAGFAIVEP
ncbi:MAG: alkyl/aryl-sulfatase [Ilumatobacteraceae bacterium]